MFKNVISKLDKDSKFKDSKQKIITNAFLVCAYFILEKSPKTDKFKSAVAQFKLVHLETKSEEKTVGEKIRTVKTEIYQEDAPVETTKVYKLEDWKKKQSVKKEPKEGAKTIKKPPVVKINGEEVTVTTLSVRSKFIVLKKTVPYVVTALLGYYVNALVALRKNGKITEKAIAEEKGLVHFITEVGKAANVDLYFKPSIFGEHSVKMGNQFNDCDGSLDTFIKTEIRSAGDFSNEELINTTTAFKHFIYVLIRYCSIFRLNKYSISNQLIYSFIAIRCSDYDLNFSTDELIKALNTDSETATEEFKKVVQKKEGGKTATKVQPTVKNVPAEEIPDFDVGGEEDFDIDGGDN